MKNDDFEGKEELIEGLKKYKESRDKEGLLSVGKRRPESQIGCAFWETLIITTIPIIFLSLFGAINYKPAQATANNAWVGIHFVFSGSLQLFYG